MPPEALRCKECKTEYPLDARYVCERCFGPLEVAYAPLAEADPAQLRARIEAGPYSLWRYTDFLPVERPETALGAGWTPLLRADRLERELGLDEVWIKNDAANPTHSFKDRVVSIGLARAQELGFRTIACASTGNLANAVAAHAAAVGLESFVFIPSDLEEQKILATGIYGTHLVAVRGNYDDVNRLCTELSGEHEWAFVNINMRPYYAEGSKTLAFEIAEQLGFELPDRVVAPIASGSLFTKLARGFGEWIDVGLVQGALPVFNGAQAAGCSPVATAFEAGQDFCRPVKPDTIAKSLAIGNPADGPYALDLARRSRRLDRQRHRRRDPRRHQAAGADDRDLHRDRRWGHDRGPAQTRRARRHRPLRAGGRGDHGRWSEDARVRPRHLRGVGDRRQGRRLRGRPRASRCRGVRGFAEMSVTVKIPTQLRACDRR